MDRNRLKRLLEEYRSGTISFEDVVAELTFPGIENLEFAHVDHQRALRQGFPEVIFCPGKSPQQIREIANRLFKRHRLLLATHADSDLYHLLCRDIPNLEYDPEARCIHSPFPSPDPLLTGAACLITGGTSDIPVAREAEVTLRMFGCTPATVYDVGAAGLHRLFHHWHSIQAASVLLVIAGMEGALPTVVAGLTDQPVIAVPTSVGYGANFQGLAPLLTMLNSCANGVAVVNIDNGFGAGFIAALFLRQMVRFLNRQGAEKDQPTDSGETP
ncbi:MAG: nickel pincer cofactor biosynthesis protein LarB [Calditrichaeota bacterium]|nr:MAG: nickel pincer cofactor biosynthesis protein LarB [Calditrichota bacterium]